jgi:hypothetical protein
LILLKYRKYKKYKEEFIMRSKGIAVLSALVITVGSIAGVVFADNVNVGIKKDGQQIVANQDNRSNSIKSAKFIGETQTPNDYSKESNISSACFSSKDANKDMVKIMRGNGFKDAARYMQTGDYEKMNEFMNNLNEEDYQEMIDIMKDSGYASMAQMMESIGREGMIQMHNSMNSMHFRSSGMMGRF